MDPVIEKIFSDFKEKNTLESINEMHNEIYKYIPNYIPNKIIRITNELSNMKCHICNKKATYAIPLTNNYVCWFHGIKIIKNN